MPGLSSEHLHDLGKLLFAFTVFWAYIAFSQFFLIWYGNIPEETIFYRRPARGRLQAGLDRARGRATSLVPFFFLLPRTVKRNAATLVGAALWMLAMHFVDVYWLVMPVAPRASARGPGWWTSRRSWPSGACSWPGSAGCS